MSTGLQGQKILYTTLFMGKVCRKNPGFDKDKTDVMFGLTLYDFASFISLYVQVKFIKVPFENKVVGLAHRSLVSPCHSFFPFLSFSLSVLLSGWLLGKQELYWISVLIKEDQASLFALLSFHLSRHPEGMRVWAMIRLTCHGSSTWPCHGWDLPWWLLAMGHLILT